MNPDTPPPVPPTKEEMTAADITETEEPKAVEPPAEGDKVDILTIEVKDQGIALRLIVNFLELANRRGVFSIPESAKIHECVQMFIIPEGSVPEGAV